MLHRGEGNSFILVRQISQAYTTFNFQLLILIYSCDLLMIIGPAVAWSAWPVPPPLLQVTEKQQIVILQIKEKRYNISQLEEKQPITSLHITKNS